MILSRTKIYGSDIAELMIMPQQKKVCKTSDGTLHTVSNYAPPGFPTNQASYIRWSYSRDNGNTWTNEDIYTHSAGTGDYDFLALCCDSYGNLYFARDDQKAGTIQTAKTFFRKAIVNKSNPANWTWSWNPEIQVGPENSSRSFPLDIIVDSHNYIHIVCTRVGYQTSWTTSRDDGITWTIGRLYATLPVSNNMMSPSIDLDSQDNLYVGFGSYYGAVVFQRPNYVQKLTWTGLESTCIELRDVDDNYVPVYTTYWKAQTFKTGGAAQKVNQISIKMYRKGTFGSAPGNKEITVSIRATLNGHPTGADLTTGTFIIDNYYPASPNFIWVNVVVPSIILNANTKYAVVVRFPSGSSASNYLAWRVDATSPPYSDGNLETSTNSGGTWTTDPNRDAMFGVYCIPWDIGTLNIVSSGNSGLCQLFVLPDDLICLAYDLNGQNVVFRKSTNPREITAWNPEVFIANGTQGGFSWEFALGCKDPTNLFAVYLMKTKNLNCDIVMSKSTDGGSTWSIPEFLTNNNFGNRGACILKEVGSDPYPDYPKIVFRDGVYSGDYGQMTAGRLWFMPVDPPDLSSFIDVGKQIQYGIAGYPQNISKTPNLVTFYGCHNSSIYLYKDFDIDYFQDFVHLIEITPGPGKDETIIFPWMLSNDIGDAKTLKDSSKDWIAIKFEIVSGSQQMSIQESNLGNPFSSTPFVTGLTKRYLKITKSGNNLEVKVFNSSEDRDNETNIQAILSLVLQSDYHFRFLFVGNTWFTHPNDEHMTKVIMENLQIS